MDGAGGLRRIDARGDDPGVPPPPSRPPSPPPREDRNIVCVECQARAVYWCMVCWRRLCSVHRQHAQACTSWASIPMSLPPETRQECAHVIARVACEPSDWEHLVLEDPPSILRPASQASAATVPSSSSGTDPPPPPPAERTWDPAQGEWTWTDPTQLPVWRSWQRGQEGRDAQQDANGQRDDQQQQREGEDDANPEWAMPCRECHTTTTRICVTCGRRVCHACASYHTMFCWRDVMELQQAVRRTEDLIGSAQPDLPPPRSLPAA